MLGPIERHHELASVGDERNPLIEQPPDVDLLVAQEPVDLPLRPNGGSEAIDQPPAPCNANRHARADAAQVASRPDIRRLPDALKRRLIRQAGRPHSQLPTPVFAEADKPSQLFEYFLLDTEGFEPNPFTTRIPGVNDKAQLTVTGANCGLPTIGAVRAVLEPKPGLPTDPEDPGAFDPTRSRTSRTSS